MYSFKSRIRYSEAARNGKLSIYSLMNYLQDCSTFQSYELGRGIEYLKNKKKAWWLAAWNIEILRLPEFREEVEISTWAYDFKSIYGYRNFAIQDITGEYLVKADSTWFFFDTEKMCPAKPTEEDIVPYMRNSKERLEIKEAGRKLEVSDKGELKGSRRMPKNYIDSNEHVNNARYVKMALDYIPESVNPKNILVQYKKSAKLNDMVLMYVNESEKDVYTISMTDEKENVYAVIKIIC